MIEIEHAPRPVNFSPDELRAIEDAISTLTSSTWVTGPSTGVSIDRSYALWLDEERNVSAIRLEDIPEPMKPLLTAIPPKPHTSAAWVIDQCSSQVFIARVRYASASPRPKR